MPSGRYEINTQDEGVITDLIFSGPGNAAAIRKLRDLTGMSVREASYCIKGWSGLWTSSAVVLNQQEALDFLSTVFATGLEPGAFKITIEGNQPLN